MADQLPHILRINANPLPYSTNSTNSTRRDSEVSALDPTFASPENSDTEDDPPSRYSSYSSSYFAVATHTTAEYRRPSDSTTIVSPISDHDIVVHTYPPAGAKYVTAAPPLPTLDEHEPLAGNGPVSTLDMRGFHPSFTTTTERRGTVRNLINKISSVRSGSRPIQSKYEQLEDDADETWGVDISGFEGPSFVAMHNLPNLKRSPTASLGSGMDSIVKASVTIGHKKTNSLADARVIKAVQQKAEEMGEIIMIEEEEIGKNVDLGTLEAELTTPIVSNFTTTTTTTKSYLFPKDVNKPSWRPFSMRPLYMSILIIIAFALAGIQEFICQLSISRSLKNDGLIKFDSAKNIPLYTYFAWKYMPTVVLVTYGIMWQVTDFEVKRLEPYYQLSQRTGATAKQSLNVDYLTVMSYIIPFTSARYKQWAVLFSSTATLLASAVLVVLQSASIYVAYLPPTTPGDDEMKIVLVRTIWSRFLSAVAGVVGLLGIFLAISLRRKSGLMSDPKGIAGIASMATKSHILAEFEGLDTATNRIIHSKLSRRRYNLHNSTLWQGKFITAAEKRKEPKKKSDKPENPHPLMLRRISGIFYILYIVIVMTLIPIFVFIRAANKVAIKLPFLLTALASLIKLLWGALDITMRVMQPYYLLWRRHAPARTLTLDYTGTVPGWLSYRAARNGDWLVAAVGLGAVFAEVLTVCVTSFQVDGLKFVVGRGGDGSDQADRTNTSETFRSFWISFAIAMFVCIYLVVVASVVYLRRSATIFPREPGSIAGVLAYIHQSKMLDDFVDTETMNSDQMTKHLEGIGKTYSLGWFTGRDRQDHCGVEQEPLLQAYKYGVDFKKARIGGEDVSKWQHL